MFTVHDTVIGAGVVGGVVVDYQRAGLQLAGLGTRILRGERLTGLVPVADGVVRPVFDWRQLRRWRISESALPPGSDVRYKTLTAWERYPRAIIGIALTGLFQAALIGLLLVERRRRRGSERQARDTEALNEAVMASVTSPVAVLGADGVVLQVNEAWMTRPGALPSVFSGWRVATSGVDDLAGLSDTHEAAPGIREALGNVLNGGTRDGVIELRDDDGDAERWYEVRIFRLERAEGGAVLSVLDRTGRKRAELEAQRHLLEMAHVNRVAALGELAASLAHELNQPLTAMLSNAQAGRRFLTAPTPNLAEVGAALDDIIQDDRRAGEVIRHMRALLTKEVFEPAEVDMNAAVRDVARLSAPAAGLGGVSVQLDLAPDLPRIRGDRVQLEQVILNLVVNAVESTTDRDGPKRVRLRTRLAADGSIEIAVSDSGPGIPSDRLDRIFEPFFTTKRDGLGMGLSISRSIIEAHGGRIEVENTGSGVTFRVRLSPTEVPAA
jgi:C4-dicarboxylate-specific signal transduction histidine kinase